ncbi:NADPH:quinone oxidoreductase family protein [Algoriphagus zhangzhouensis]|uniref:NADPH2:quinone reductase n=1 Tax=Algoriphagus zhangzhouensis TaxID=1073327 RepID=A0A1M7ZAE3_9BACT|nr:NADPH:quinone oxidoreductase family protein [Algoriphagus zhangzhouensis]TDY47158.1 NADPH2:quinone reductase [Algoriphagus zhangzhouensis]SHO61883.1 NADPH2:quinone reductase [Algoriphagus zhangzhouensis]
MKALICEKFGMPETLQVGEIPDPIPGPNQVLVQVEACGVNFPDTLIIQNKYQFKPELPFSPGGELVGKVIECGKDVSSFQVGDYVLGLSGWGGMAEKALVDEDRIFALPKGIPAEVAASTLYTYATSFYALKDRGRLEKEEILLVLGAGGGIGLAAVELAKLMGAKVIAAASSVDKLEAAKAKGADLTINYSEEDLKARVKELTGGKGVDMVLDPVGGFYTELALRGMAWGGRYLIVGFTQGEIPKIPMNLPLLKGCSILGVFWGDFSRKEADKNRENLNQLMNWISEGKIQKPIVSKYSLEDAPKAIRAMMDRKLVGKVVVVI